MNNPVEQVRAAMGEMAEILIDNNPFARDRVEAALADQFKTVAVSVGLPDNGAAEELAGAVVDLLPAAHMSALVAEYEDALLRFKRDFVDVPGEAEESAA